MNAKAKRPYKKRPLADRFWEKVDKSGHCWEWLGIKRPTGYGRFSVDRQPLQAHRVAYELVVGPIPEGLTLDHLCRNPGCVNPDHLEPVTLAENLRRGARFRPRAEHCPRGHGYVRVAGRPVCRTCEAERARRWRKTNPARHAAQQRAWRAGR